MSTGASHVAHAHSRQRSLTRIATIAACACSLAIAACDRAAPPSANAASAGRARETPRFPDGRVDFDREPGAEKGYWGPASLSSLVETGVSVAMDERGLLASVDEAPRVAPFQPWALALYQYRQRNGLQDDPVRACLSPGSPRHMQYPGGFRIVQDRNYERVYVLFGGGNRNWRVIFLDGREPPNPEEVTGTYFGYSVGHWDGDTLVVDSTGFSSRFWFSNGGLPHTEALRLTERFARPDFDTLRYSVTIDDPRTYTRPWTSEWTVRWVHGGEIVEQFCEE